MICFSKVMMANLSYWWRLIFPSPSTPSVYFFSFPARRALFSTLEDEDWGHLYLTMGAFDEVRSAVQKL